MSRAFIGLDLATSDYGVAVVYEDGASPQLFQLRAKGDLFQRLNLVSFQVAEVVKQVAASSAVIIGVEELPTRNAFAVTKLARLRGWVEARLWAIGYNVEGCPLASVRKLMGSGGRVEKEDVKRAVDVLFGRVVGADEADAFAVANFLSYKHGGPFLAGLVPDKSVQGTVAKEAAEGVPGKPRRASTKGRSKVSKP